MCRSSNQQPEKWSSEGLLMFAYVCLVEEFILAKEHQNTT